ncbi:MAG: PP0621 family protein [Deltaproteobacteria bacterium]|jgi:YHS domain-containing protein|nr:PP0621 family protein [Deltaproteobacteria bacterium]MCW8892029.1 PP0621 family protein [Deltaproteobacteria bacterium]MCW9049669.1 PP0621 family protein [Deltaproteobacteria bacterium]
MIKLLLLVLAGFVCYSMISGLLRPGRTRQPKNRTDEGETMVEDPQCGTFLPLSEAVKATIHGRQHYFCSKKCLKEYKKTQNP